MSELRKRLEEVRSKVLSSVERVKGQIPIIGERKGMAGQINIGGGQIMGVAEDITKTVKDYVESMKSGKVVDVMRVAPFRKRLERRFPQLSKLPRIREVPLHERPAGVSLKPEAPKVKEEALAKKPPEMRETHERPALF